MPETRGSYSPINRGHRLPYELRRMRLRSTLDDIIEPTVRLSSRSVRDICGFIVEPPGWRPDGETTEELRHRADRPSSGDCR